LWSPEPSMLFNLKILPVVFSLSLAATVQAQFLSVSNGSLNSPTVQQLLAQVSAETAALPKPIEDPQDKIVSAKGPWGNIEYFPFYLEAPDHLIEQFPLPNSTPRWAFPLAAEAGVKDMLLAAGLSTAVVDSIYSKLPARDAEHVFLFPSPSILENMDATVRAKIYSELRKSPINQYHVDPVLILSGDVDRWFMDSALTAAQVAMVKKLSYMRGQCLAFSDLELLMSQASGEQELRTIMRSLTRCRSLLVNFKLEPNLDIASVLAYWTTGLGTRRKDLQTMLKTLTAIRPGSDLDLSHLLPATPRKLLLTYPDTSMAAQGVMPDCHWSSLNFFNYEVQPYLLDSRLATTAVLERFAPTEAPYKFGDIIFVVSKDTGDAFHSCVYIADDIVFTKNGRNIVSPWVLMKISDVERIYVHDGNGKLQGYRSKNAPALPLPTATASSAQP
jgi:hypothetical protein